ncbi:MAG: hypothetical protein ACTSSJ_03250 [Candidatus Odinarchaeia archaeon]
MSERLQLSDVLTKIEELKSKVDSIILKLKSVDCEMDSIRRNIIELSSITKVLFGEVELIKGSSVSKDDLEILKLYSKLVSELEVKIALYKYLKSIGE